MAEKLLLSTVEAQEIPRFSMGHVGVVEQFMGCTGRQARFAITQFRWAIPPGGWCFAFQGDGTVG